MADILRLQELLSSIAQLAPVLNKAINTRTAPNSLHLEGLTVAQIRQQFASASQADFVALRDAVNAFIVRRDNPHAVNKDQVGLSNVANYAPATNEQAVAGTATDLVVTPAAARALLDAFWADQVGSAPETLDTIGEISAALANNPDIVNQLLQSTGENRRLIDELTTTVTTNRDEVNTALDGKLDAGAQATDAAALGGLSLDQVIDEARRVSNFVDLVAVSPALLTGTPAELDAALAGFVRDTGAPTVAGVVSVEGVVNASDMGIVLDGLTSGDAAGIGIATIVGGAGTATSYREFAFTSGARVGQVWVQGANADGTFSAWKLQGVDQAALDAKLDKTATAANSALHEGKTVAQIVQQAVTASNLDSKLDKTAQAVDSAKLEGRDVATLTTEILAGKAADAGMLDGRTREALTTEILAGQAADAKLLEGKTVAQITDAITGGSTETLLAIRNALDAFIANKATTEEAVVGVNNTKYITPVTLRAGVDAAITALVDGAPTALDTLRELADRLTTEGDAVAALTAAIDALRGRVDALEGRATDIEGRVTATEGRLTDIETGAAGSNGRLDALEPRVTTAEGDIVALRDGKLDKTAQAADSLLLEGKNRQSILDDAAAQVAEGDFATQTDLQRMADEMTVSFEDATDVIEGLTRFRTVMTVADLGAGRFGYNGANGALDPATILGAPIVEMSWTGTTGVVRITGDVTANDFRDLIIDGVVATGLTAAFDGGAGETTLTATFDSTAAIGTTGTIRAALRYAA